VRKETCVIHIDSFRREYFSNYLLAALLKKNGYRVFLTSRGTTSIFCRIFTPDVLVLSHPFALPQSMLHKLQRKGCRIYVNEVEGVIGSENGIATTYINDIDYSLYSGIFVWNTWSRDGLLEKRQVAADKVFVTGSVRNFFLDPSLKPLFGLKEKKTVGILSRFELLNTFDGRHLFENLTIMNIFEPTHAWFFKRIGIEARQFSLLNLMVSDGVKSGLRFSIRPHPNENTRAYDILIRKFGSAVEVDRSIDITEFLNKCSVVVGPTSSAYTEAYLLGKPIISLDPVINEPHDPVIAKLLKDFQDLSYQPGGFDDLMQAAQTLPGLSEYNEVNMDFLERFYSIRSHSDPIAEVVDIIRNESSPAKSGIANAPWLMRLAKWSIELFVILRRTSDGHPLRHFRLYRLYNYNSLLHKATPFMQDVRKAFMKAH
jgi:surface carbohydrate biosynthesis protein